MSRLDRAAQRELLRLARDAIQQRLMTGRVAPCAPENTVIREPSGAFVTLKEAGQLRGCIGCPAALKPLYQTVRDCAVAAALEDPRFPPLGPEELDLITLEISVLTPPRPLRQFRDLRLGQHGLLVSLGGKRGLLLPQVAVENDWDRETFLRHACLKAGLPPDAWRQEARLEIFTAEVFHEEVPDPAQAGFPG